MLLNELFKKSSHFDVVHQGETEYKSIGIVNGSKVEFWAQLTPPNNDSWSIGFIVDGDDGITNTGNQFAIFATVFDMLGEFTRMYNPPRVTFDAEGASRQSLYQKMINKYSQSYGYELARTAKHGVIPKYNVYTLVKKKKPVKELFDKPMGSNIEQDDDVAFTASAPIDDENMLMFAASHFGSNNWGIFFAVNGNMSLTQKGNEIAIFSTVIDLLKKFVKERKPKTIRFTGDEAEGGRVDLYRRLVRRFAATHKYSASETPSGRSIEFILHRDNT
jgi:hypothetical protein